MQSIKISMISVPASRNCREPGLACSNLELLGDVNRQIACVLAASRASVARCEQALQLLSDIRLRASAEQRPSRTISANGAQLPSTLNGRDDHHCALNRVDLLTARETELLQLIAAGTSNRQIADTLYLSPRTL